MAKSKTAKTTTDAAAKPADENIVKGENQDRSIQEQVKIARGEEDQKADLGGEIDSRNKEAHDLRNEADPARKATDLAVEARADYLKSQGVTPGNEGMGDSGGLKKVETGKVSNDKKYQGLVTMHSIHGQTHEKLSYRAEIPNPSGEEYLKYVFKNAHPHAMVNETFEVDENNDSDPMLRSRYE